MVWGNIAQTQPFFGSVLRSWGILPDLGLVFDSSRADKAFQRGELRSIGSGQHVRLAFRNDTPAPLILCWLDGKGNPHHFYEVPPSASSGGPVSRANFDHIEQACMNHAFCFALKEDVEDKKLHHIIGGYIPKRTIADDDGNFHLVTITPQRARGCCDATPEFSVTAKKADFDRTPIDTSDKYYEKSDIAGWPVRLEKNWHGGDRKLKGLFEEHLRTAVGCLPKHAREQLKKDTPFFINKSLRYGPAVCPVKGRAMCFHPGAGWLKSNGMSTEKAGCVEIYEFQEYKDDCDMWGPGGVLLHELCHAYHHKMLDKGYDNPDIQECYEAAMRDGLYDCVRVHGTQGPTARAYACENAMEYFAELSVAFLAGKDKKIEYNKWQPFNREELKNFDPRAYELLRKVWKIE